MHSVVASWRMVAHDRYGREPLAAATPAALFGPLLEEVQLRRLFGDGKTFVDSVPKRPAAEILAAFRDVERRDEPVRAFVHDHFVLPEPARVHEGGAGEDLRRYIASAWPDLTRPPTVGAPDASMLSVPGPFTVPGGRFAELYYWDSYFALLGLVRDGHEAMAQSVVDCLTSMIERHGYVPNGSRTYYLGRSQPPLYFAMLELLPSADPAVQRRRLAAMLAEHAFWMRGAEGLPTGAASARVVAMPDGAVLNRYWDPSDAPRDESYAEDVATAAASASPAPFVFRALRAGAESGWDFSSRWLRHGGDLTSIRTQAIVPVDLNSLLYGLERAIARLADRLGQVPKACLFHAAARRRRAAIRQWLWSKRGFFVDYDLEEAKRSSAPTAAAAAPLFVGLATWAQAAATARMVAATLLAPGGLRTTTVNTGEQWDAPNGWAPLQWIAFAGLRRYGHGALADEIAARWVALVEAEFRGSGAVHEKYDVETGGRGKGGEYVPQLGFGWTNGVTASFIDHLRGRAGPDAPAPAAAADTDR